MGPTVLALLLTKNMKEVTAVSLVYIATILSMVMLAEIVAELTSESPLTLGGEPDKKTKIMLLFGGKIILLLLSLLIGVHLMEKRVIIPLLNYVIHIFVYVISIRKELAVKDEII